MMRLLVLLAALVSLVAPLDALARGTDDDVRVAGRCSRSSDVSLRVRADDGRLRVELRVDTNRARAAWQVVLLHDRRLAFRKTLRTGSSSRSLRVRRELPDWFGRDTVVARATGPRGETCRASATI
jgi:hypothetical protein